MATIFKRRGSPFWQISYFHEGKRITKSLGTSDRTVASSEKKKLEGKLEEKTHEEYGKASLTDMVELYKKSKVERKAKTNQNEFQILDNFVEATNKKTLAAISENDLLQYLERYRKSSPYTFRNALASIKRLFAFAVKRKKISMQKNPAADIEFRRIIKKRPTFFTDTEYLAIEKASEGSPIFKLIVTARYTGLRLAELRHLEWEDFDWNKREVAVKNKPQFNHTVKNYQVRNVPIPEQLLFKLLPYRKEKGLCFPTPNGGVYSIQGPRKALNNMLAKAGLKDKPTKDEKEVIDTGKPRKGKGEGFHTFRRTFASRLVQNGADIVLVSKWLGHRSIAVTEAHYADFRPRYHADIERLNIREDADTADNFADNANLAGVRKAVNH